MIRFRQRFFGEGSDAVIDGALVAGGIGAGMYGLERLDNKKGWSKDLDAGLGIKREGESLGQKLKRKYVDLRSGGSGLKKLIQKDEYAVLRGDSNPIEELKEKLNNPNLSPDEKLKLEKKLKELKKMKIVGKVGEKYTNSLNWMRDSWNKGGTTGKLKVAAIPVGIGATVGGIKYIKGNDNTEE